MRLLAFSPLFCRWPLLGLVPLLLAAAFTGITGTVRAHDDGLRASVTANTSKTKRRTSSNDGGNR